MSLLDRVAQAMPGRRDESRFSIDAWLSDYLLPANEFSYNGSTYPFGLNTTWTPSRSKEISNTLPGYMAALRSCPPAFGAQLVRASVLSQARFCFRNADWSPRAGRTFTTSALGPLQKPWTNATTGQLINIMEWHEGLAGNAYVTNRTPGRLRVLRPDWVVIIYGSQQQPEDAAHALDGELIGYGYCNGGLAAGRYPVEILLPDEVAHWSPQPDPECAGIGMSWITPAVREIQGDTAATSHKLRFFENGATPNLVVKGLAATSKEQFDELVDMMETRHAGVRNAYRTLYLTAGADATVVGADLRQLDFKATQGAGEPLALDTPVPTPTGWTTMGEVKVGDRVIGRDGQPANVVGVSPVHLGRDCYRITLRDRTSIVADASHLWVAVDRGSASRAEKQYTTRELYDLARRGYPNGAGGYRMALPAAPVIELPAADLLVDPYVLGAWLGDGQTAGAAICGAPDDLKFIAAEIESRGYVTTPWSTAPGKVSVVGIPGGLLAALRALGVLGDKHIPAAYLRASVEQRLDLLRGLMDTDGSVDEGRGGCEYGSKDETLARQVIELLRSIGYKTTLSFSPDARSRTGGMWRVHFRVAQDRIPFLLPRKVDRCVRVGDPHYSDTRAIVSIEPVDSVPVRCIAVDTEDHLFLAGDGFVPTHNTRISMLSRVHPVILGASEGLSGSSLNAGNFGAARRMWADTWIYPTLADLAAALAPLVRVPGDAELWTNVRDMPILREDAKDAADIESTKASTIVKLSQSGFTRESAVAAVMAEDMTLLKEDPNWVSVQLQQSGAVAPALPAPTPALPGRPKPPALPAGGPK